MTGSLMIICYSLAGGQKSYDFLACPSITRCPVGHCQFCKDYLWMTDPAGGNVLLHRGRPVTGSLVMTCMNTLLPLPALLVGFHQVKQPFYRHVTHWSFPQNGMSIKEARKNSNKYVKFYLLEYKNLVWPKNKCQPFCFFKCEQ